jgi:pimeloyl-ACP methyl ester carboxylesterase
MLYTDGVLRRLRRLARWVLILWVALALLTTGASFVYNAVSQGTVPVPKGDGRFVRTGDVRTYYRQWGTAGTPVVLVHGFMESSFAWHLFGPELARRGYRVFAIDVRGFGYTDRRPPYTLSADTRQLAEFIAALHLDSAHGGSPVLVGHSSGAAIVGNLARTQSSKVAGIVFADGDGTPYGAGPTWVRGFVRDPWMISVVRLVTRHPSLVRPFYRRLCGSTCPAWTKKEAAGWATPFRVAGAEDALEAVLHQGLIGMSGAEISAIRVPAAVVRADGDPQMGLRLAQLTARRLHTDMLTTIRHSGHLVMLAQPGALAATIDADARRFGIPAR